MRAMLMRPSSKRRSRVRLATSRRIGLKHEMITLPGASSIITSQPESWLKARMLRPSLPMILPVWSSRIGTATVLCSATCSPA